jgi:hypothetical protein
MKPARSPASREDTAERRLAPAPAGGSAADLDFVRPIAPAERPGGVPLTDDALPGLPHGEVRLSRWTTLWQILFDQEARRLRGALGPLERCGP